MLIKMTNEQADKKQDRSPAFTAWHKNARDFSREMNCASFFLLYSYLTK